MTIVQNFHRVEITDIWQYVFLFHILESIPLNIHKI